MPTISVIVPVYKVENYIHRCVDSILNQTYRDFELILVDDGSPDNCGTICDEYAAKDSRIVVIHQKNGGLSAARNAGIDWAFANSDSEWLTFVDSDDWVHPQYLEVLYSAVKKDGTNLSMCLHISAEIFAPFQELPEVQTELLPSDSAYLLNGKVPYAYSWARLYNKSACFSSCRFPVGKYWEDQFTTYKILYSLDKISVIQLPLYYYFVNPAGIVRSPWSPKKLDQLEAYEEQLAYFHQAHNTYMFQIIANIYIRTIFNNYTELKSQENNNPQLHVYKPHLQKKMRSALIRLSKAGNISFKKDTHFYDLGFPKLMYLYWTMQGIKHKLKKLIENG